MRNESGLHPKPAATRISDDLLKGMAAQAFNMAKLDLERERFNFLLAAYHEGEGLRRMAKVEALIIEKLGENWLNSGRTKDVGFHLLRIACGLKPPDAFAICTVVNWFKPSAAFFKLPPKKQQALLEAGHDKQHQAVAEGLMIVRDALNAVVQTPERVCIYIQGIRPPAETDGSPKIDFYDQADFGGRIKMFGEEKP